MTDWTKYGLLQSPLESLGVSQHLYDNTKKVERITNTNDYVKKKNELLGALVPNINKAFEEIMNHEKLKDVPLIERQRVATKIAAQQKDLVYKIVEEVYPDAEKALIQASHITEAKDIVAGNVGDKKARKPRKAKASKAPKKATSGKKRGRPTGSKNKKK